MQYCGTSNVVFTDYWSQYNPKSAILHIKITLTVSCLGDQGFVKVSLFCLSLDRLSKPLTSWQSSGQAIKMVFMPRFINLCILAWVKSWTGGIPILRKSLWRWFIPTWHDHSQSKNAQKNSKYLITFYTCFHCTLYHIKHPLFITSIPLYYQFSSP